LFAPDLGRSQLRVGEVVVKARVDVRFNVRREARREVLGFTVRVG